MWVKYTSLLSQETIYAWKEGNRKQKDFLWSLRNYKHWIIDRTQDDYVTAVKKQERGTEALVKSKLQTSIDVHYSRT